MAKPTQKRRSPIDENVTAAHEALVDSSQKVGKAANVLMRRIEELSTDLEEAEERYSKDLHAAESKYTSDLGAAEKARERDVQAVKLEKAKVESDLKDRIAALETENQRLAEKLRKVQATLA